MDALEARVREVACWNGPVTLAPLAGGLTNRAWVATDNNGKYVVRCGGDIPVHQILRDREREASIAAYEAGLSPAVVRAEPGVLERDVRQFHCARVRDGERVTHMVARVGRPSRRRHRRGE